MKTGYPYTGPQGIPGQTSWDKQGPHQRGGGSTGLGQDIKYGVFLRGHMSDKVPPSWGPERQASYPFRAWVRDVCLWEYGTTLEANKR